MQLRESEQILKIYRRHLFPTAVKIVEILLGSVVFYILIYWMRRELSLGVLFWVITAITAIFLLLILHVIMDDRMDKLIITNQRVVFVDWRMILFKSENDIDIRDIQEVTVTSRGILARLKIFNFGICLIETASHDLSIKFSNAPHPNEIRDFILSLKRV